MRHLIITLIMTALYIQGYPQTNENMSRITGEFYKDSELYYKVESHGKIFEIDDYTYRQCEPARKIITDSDFKLLPYEEFREKILELFNVDMDTTYFYYPDEYTMPWLCIIHDGYIEYDDVFFDPGGGVKGQKYMYGLTSLYYMTISMPSTGLEIIRQG